MKLLKLFSLILFLSGYSLFFLPFFLPASAQDNVKPVYKLRQVQTLKLPENRKFLLKPLKVRPFPVHKLPRPVIPVKPAEPEGPDPAAAIDLADVIESAELLQDISAAAGWDSHMIFQDRAAGNVFYYIPREFLLVYDRGGYHLSVQYNQQAEPGKPSVTLVAELAAPYHTGDTALLKAILRESFSLKPQDRLEIKSIKGLGASVDMAPLSAGFAIGPERISVTLPAHLRQPLRMTLSLSQDEVEAILAQIAAEGVAGTLNIQVADSSVPIPIRIQYGAFAGEKIAGFRDWLHGAELDAFENITPFPVTLEGINGYCLKNNRLERIAKRLKSSSPIPPKGKRPVKLPPAERVLGKGVLLGWLDLTLDTNCRSCIEKIDRSVRRGVAVTPATTVKFSAIPSVFSEFGIYQIIVSVKSPYFGMNRGKVEKR
ncbi:hypothetical protein [Desulfolithobacter sp.]